MKERNDLHDILDRVNPLHLLNKSDYGFALFESPLACYRDFFLRLYSENPAGYIDLPLALYDNIKDMTISKAMDMVDQHLPELENLSGLLGLDWENKVEVSRELERVCMMIHSYFGTTWRKNAFDNAMREFLEYLNERG